MIRKKVGCAKGGILQHDLQVRARDRLRNGVTAQVEILEADHADTTALNEQVTCAVQVVNRIVANADDAVVRSLQTRFFNSLPGYGRPMLVKQCYVILTATVRPNAPVLPLAGDEEQREAEYLEALLLQEIVSEVSVEEIETCCFLTITGRLQLRNIDPIVQSAQIQTRIAL